MKTTKNSGEKKVTLVDLFNSRRFMSRLQFHPPLGLLSIAGAIRESVTQVNIIDSIKDLDTDLIEDTDIFGIRTMTCYFNEALKILEKVKQINPNIKTVIGGFHSSLRPKDANKNFVDHIVIGEGEIAFRKIVEGKVRSKIIVEPLIKNIDNLPFPAYDLVDKTKYHIFGLRYISLETARGCPFKCNFCSVRKFYHDEYRTKSIPRIIQEIKQYEPRAIFFTDDNHIVNVKRSSDLCDAIINEGLDE